MRQWLTRPIRRLFIWAFPNVLEQYQELKNQQTALASTFEQAQADHDKELDRLYRIINLLVTNQKITYNNFDKENANFDFETKFLEWVLDEILCTKPKLTRRVREALCELKNAPQYSIFTAPDGISIVLPQDSELPIGSGLVASKLVGAYESDTVKLHLVTSDGSCYCLSDELEKMHVRRLILTLCAIWKDETNTEAKKLTILDPKHLRQIANLPLLAAHVAQAIDPDLPPYSNPLGLRSAIPAIPKRRSVLFARNCYYNFFYLAEALRKRGWDAVTLSTEPDDSDTQRFGHGEDIRLFDPDPDNQRISLERFYTNIPERFGIVHTYGLFGLSILPTSQPTRPWDIMELKRHQVLIGYSHSGCLDGIRQSIFSEWSGGMCDHCVWRDQPTICSDEKNASWGHLVTNWVDLFCSETDPYIDFKASPSVFREPLTFAMDAEFWRPSLAIPEDMKIPREKNEIIIYHAVGNYKKRTRNGLNVKGSEYVVSAVDRLKSEGYPVRLSFFENVPSKQNRFVQLQSDIMVDQLMYGRYGALAREGMMLGIPVVGRVNKEDAPGVPATKCIQETPIVHATTETIYDVLKHLVLNPEERASIGAASREHALKWWSADRLAERFEKVYDYIEKYGSVPPEGFLDQ